MVFYSTGLSQPLRYISSGLFTTCQPWIHSKRNLDSYLLIIGLEGTLHIQQEEQQYQVRPGDTLLLLPYHTHFGYQMSESQLSYYWCHFQTRDEMKLLDQEAFVQEVSLMKTREPDHVVSPRIMIPDHASFDDCRKIIILFKQLLHTAYANYYTMYGTNYLLSLVMIELTEQSIRKFYGGDTEHPSNSKINEIQEWIRIHMTSHLTVSDIAHRFNYNPDYLSRVFKEKTGFTVQQYIHNIRITKSKEMLLSSDNSIKEIAYRLGFHDEKYFMKLFKQCENITPTQYRNAYCYTHLNNR